MLPYQRREEAGMGTLVSGLKAASVGHSFLSCSGLSGRATVDSESQRKPSGKERQELANEMQGT